MAQYWLDNVHTTALSPRDYQVELLAAAREKNTIVCLDHSQPKEFIALKLIHEMAPALRSGDRRHTVYLSADGRSTYNHVFHLTDLRVINLNYASDVVYDAAADDAKVPVVDYTIIDWPAITATNQVLIVSPVLCRAALQHGHLHMSTINLIVIEDCHLSAFGVDLTAILAGLSALPPTHEPPRILGLAGPLHSAGCPPGHLAAELRHLEERLHCAAESASDIVTVLRYCNAPVELLLQCAPPPSPLDAASLGAVLRDLVGTRLAFLRAHRFDPSEIYSDEFLEEMQSYPDPKAEPVALLGEFVQVLDELGAWCADRAALASLQRIERMKVKTPYERHFLLLCMASTTLVQVRAHCEAAFGQLANERERIERYSTAKVHRLLQVLRMFRPPSNPPPPPAVTKNASGAIAAEQPRVLAQLDALNFDQCRRTAEQMRRKLVDEASDRDSTTQKITNGLNRILLDGAPKNGKSEAAAPPPQRQRQAHNHRPTFPRQPRTNWSYLNDPNALCGLLFCHSQVVARILFSLLSEMSRNSEDLAYLTVLFTVDRQADPLTDSKEAAAEHRKQEEVLKRFRMHECNLLIGTAVLEEGIDLPKCNLVLRWDPPRTYRSYVQCKGKARAANAFYVMLVADKAIADDQEQDEQHQQLSARSHRWLCAQHNRSDAAAVHCLIAEPPAQTAAAEAAAYARQLERTATITDEIVQELSRYQHIEQMLQLHCENAEPPPAEQQHAERFSALLESYRPQSTAAAQDVSVGASVGASVGLGTAIALLNKYCAKLPSDTFTKLTPLWRCARTAAPRHDSTHYYQYSIRLPINSPCKRDIVGLPMPTRILARRAAALAACRLLHRSGELDGQLQPIGKESFRATEPDWECFELEQADEAIVSGQLEPRPGTTKRRQYYYKRIAAAFCGCRPSVGEDCHLYLISMRLECPIPEEQNTRGRRIYPPEESAQSFGILTRRRIPKISAFPIFTRSGEVKVSLQLIRSDVRFDDERLAHINTFLSYTFTKVLRLQKYLMLFDAEATENSFFVVPTRREEASGAVHVDWAFLAMIAGAHDRMPVPVPEAQRRAERFTETRFRDAVVMPWYRNQDQPQYFYVAEICEQLSPESRFPGENYRTFREYYHRKYGIRIQDQRQPLLDVDHTSARLNFLTPRYVNRKGVALPTSSEETKRAKRENLEQKQILVPELCTIHPFPASLWRAAVCLPCVLYRINALLLADEIRLRVAAELGGSEGGTMTVEERTAGAFEWPMLNFGWSLAEVLRKARETKAKGGKLGVAESAGMGREAIMASPVNGFGRDETKAAAAKPKCNGASVGEEASDDEDRLEIGTWTNDMAKEIDRDELFDSDGEYPELPNNVKMCSSDHIRYGSPTSWHPRGKTAAAKPTSGYSSDDSLGSVDDDDNSFDDDFDSDTFDDTDGPADDEEDNDDGMNIEFKSDNVAEAIDSEQDIRKRQRQLEIINNINASSDQANRNARTLGCGFDAFSTANAESMAAQHIVEQSAKFELDIGEFRQRITKPGGVLVRHDESFDERINSLRRQPGAAVALATAPTSAGACALLQELLPFVPADVLQALAARSPRPQLGWDELHDLYRVHYFDDAALSERYIIEGTGDLFDQFNYSPIEANTASGKCLRLPADEFFADRVVRRVRNTRGSPHSQIASTVPGHPSAPFSFDAQPDLTDHPGPSPSIILQALTMSNANDGINLERLETIGDSFLKYAITTYLYCTYEDVHEGKLSHLRSKQVSNLNLYRLGRRKMFGECMIATKFEPHDNWLPPCYYVPRELEKALIAAGIPAYHWNLADLPNIKELSSEQICALVKRKAEALGLQLDGNGDAAAAVVNGEQHTEAPEAEVAADGADNAADHFTCFIPYNLVTQHSIPDKSVADCVEALIGAYLIDCGQRGALLFMAWLGIRVLPCLEGGDGSRYGHWALPKSPLLLHASEPQRRLERLLDGYDAFEASIGYQFRDRSYLLQAMTHASYTANRLTDCYQRLEFLGDAVLDYLITRHLYEDPRQHSPGALTDLRSALVNNTIFASLAVRHGFHKYFRHLSPGLNEVIGRFVRIQHENGHSISEEFYLISEEECDEAEDVEVPKALGDVFESVAGAIFLDSNMSLDTVWRIYSNMMRPEIELFSNSVPKSPIRELLELEPETAKFSKPEKLADGRRVRVSVEVFGKGTFRGIGRNYRIAKCTAAKCALRQLKKQGLIRKH